MYSSLRKPLYSSLRIPLYSSLRIPLYISLRIPLYSRLRIPLYSSLRIPLYSSLRIQVYSSLRIPLYSRNTWKYNLTPIIKLNRVSFYLLLNAEAKKNLQSKENLEKMQNIKSKTSANIRVFCNSSWAKEDIIKMYFFQIPGLMMPPSNIHPSIYQICGTQGINQ